MRRLPTAAGEDGSLYASQGDLKHVAAGAKRINEMRAFGADDTAHPVPGAVSPLARHLWGHFWGFQKWVTLPERRGKGGTSLSSGFANSCGCLRALPTPILARTWVVPQNVTRTASCHERGAPWEKLPDPVPARLGRFADVVPLIEPGAPVSTPLRTLPGKS